MTDCECTMCERVEAVLAYHYARKIKGAIICDVCQEPFPCKTVRLLDGK